MDPEYNAVALRKVNNTIRDSIKAEIEWAINTLGVAHLWEYRSGFQEWWYKPTGQMIKLRSIQVDKATGKTKLSGMNVPKGFIKDIWLEEAYEFNKKDYKMIVQTMRGSPYSIIFSANPWVETQFVIKWALDVLGIDLLQLEKHLKQDGEIYVNKPDAMNGMGITVHWMNWMINDKLDVSDIQERLAEKETDPEEYQVAGYGLPGITDGAVFQGYNNKFKWMTYNQAVKATTEMSGGIDYGVVRDATAATLSGVVGDYNGKVFMSEYYHSNGEKLTNQEKPWSRNDLEDYVDELYEFYYNYLDLIKIKGGIKVKVETAGAGQDLRVMLNKRSKAEGTYPLIKFIKTTKFEIVDRVRADRKMLSYGMFYLVEGEMSMMLAEYKNLRWKASHVAENGLTEAIDETSWSNHIWDAVCYDNSKHVKKLLPTFKFIKNIDSSKEEE